MEDILISKCCKAEVYDGEGFGYDCSKCEKHCEVESVCPICFGTGEICEDEDDGEGHSAKGVNVRQCPSCGPRRLTFSVYSQPDFKEVVNLKINGHSQRIKRFEARRSESIHPKRIFKFLLFTGLLAAFFVAMLYSINKSEVVRCNELIKQSGEGYTNFFISQYEQQMCSTHGITINAPVK